MAVLTSADIDQIYREWMEQMSRAGEPVSIVKGNVRAMIVAQDQWFSDNVASANQAIPQPARSAISTAGKARAASLIMTKRWITGAG